LGIFRQRFGVKADSGAFFARRVAASSTLVRRLLVLLFGYVSHIALTPKESSLLQTLHRKGVCAWERRLVAESDIVRVSTPCNTMSIYEAIWT
jgi:hypothetical protein